MDGDARCCLRGSGFEACVSASGYVPADYPGEPQMVAGIVSLINTTGDLEWRADAAVTFRPEQLAAFHAELTALLDDLNGEATLRDRWNVLELHLRLEAGKGEISGRIEELGLARMEFEGVMTDQSCLSGAVAGIREILERFPPRTER